MRVLHLVGSAVSPFSADLSRRHVADCLAATAAAMPSAPVIGYTTPDGRRRFPPTWARPLVERYVELGREVRCALLEPGGRADRPGPPPVQVGSVTWAPGRSWADSTRPSMLIRMSPRCGRPVPVVRFAAPEDFDT